MVEKLSDTDESHYAFLIPIMKSLIEKYYSLLRMNVQVPNIPFSNASETFYDDFKDYCKCVEKGNRKQQPNSGSGSAQNKNKWKKDHMAYMNSMKSLERKFIKLSKKAKKSSHSYKHKRYVLTDSSDDSSSNNK